VSDATHTVKHVLEAGPAFLTDRGVPEARLKCELLAARLLNCQRLDLYMRFDETLAPPYLEAMRRGIKRLAEGEPVQHIMGEVGFHGHRFSVDGRALIPRPETEGLVQAVLDWEAMPPDGCVVDIGTGSGCIIISLALARPGWRCLGLDVSPEALALAGQNATALGVADRVQFTIEGLADCVEPEGVDAIVANLPYIATEACDTLPADVRDHDPRLALDGGADGLDIRNAGRRSDYHSAQRRVPGDPGTAGSGRTRPRGLRHYSSLSNTSLTSRGAPAAPKRARCGAKFPMSRR